MRWLEVSRGIKVAVTSRKT